MKKDIHYADDARKQLLKWVETVANVVKVTMWPTGRNVVYYEYYPKLSKRLIDIIDEAIAKHYGFTQEEVDYIANFDIKFRMGGELNEE